MQVKFIMAHAELQLSNKIMCVYICNISSDISDGTHSLTFFCDNSSTGMSFITMLCFMVHGVAFHNFKYELLIMMEMVMS